MAKLTIKIKSYLNIDEEVLAAGAITPGYLIERTSAGKVQAHSTAGGPCFPMFALEDAYQGRKITDAYASTGDNQLVQVWTPTRGDVVYATVKSTSEALVIGSFVESAGDGTIRKYDIASTGTAIEGSHVIIGRAIAAIVASAKGLIEII